MSHARAGNLADLPDMVIYLLAAIVLAGIIFSCLFIIYEHNSPSATMAWLLAMIFLPFIGLFAYFMFGRRRVTMRVQLLKAIRDEVGDIRDKLNFDGAMKAVLKTTGDSRHHGLMLLGYRFPGLPPTLGNTMEVLKDAVEAYPEIMKGISGAKNHIHAIYYIIQPDDSGRAFRDALTERARAGVEVRLLYDDIGSWRIKPEFFKPLVEAGGKVHAYRPVSFSRFRTIYSNFRNHRKIVVIDGQIAFTGGINIGDEYLGKVSEFGFWRDTNIKITGPAASHLQLVFAEDWYYVTGELLTESYVSHPPAEGDYEGVVQIVPSGPDRSREQVAQLYFTAITSARNTLYITTPYFVPDAAVQAALVAACLRGVDVRLLVPGKPDRKIMKYASRSYYREIMNAGGKIYEYKKGFVHSKTLSADGDLGIIGTANMDIRSFLLNFEVCAVCYDKEVARELDWQFMEDLKDSERLRRGTFSKRPRVDIFLENTARLLSSLL